jgi:hypothetical protein
VSDFHVISQFKNLLFFGLYDFNTFERTIVCLFPFYILVIFINQLLYVLELIIDSTASRGGRRPLELIISLSKYSVLLCEWLWSFFVLFFDFFWIVITNTFLLIPNYTKNYFHAGLFYLLSNFGINNGISWYFFSVFISYMQWYLNWAPC